jgi:hypothetical protein
LVTQGRSTTPIPITELIGGDTSPLRRGAIALGACLANAVSDTLAPRGVAVAATPMIPESVLRLIHGASR